MTFKIAHIDDCMDDLLLFKLRALNYDVHQFSCYGEYLSSLSDYDVVVSDFNMPDYSADNLEGCIRKQKCPFFIYTGARIELLGAGNMEHLMSMGVDGFYCKGRDDDRLWDDITSIKRRKKVDVFF